MTKERKTDENCHGASAKNLNSKRTMSELNPEGLENQMYSTSAVCTLTKKSCS